MAAIFVNNIFKVIFFNENCHILIQISLKYATKDPIDYKPSLGLIMAWHLTSNKSEPMMA